MRRTSIIYSVLAILFLIAVSFSVYFYNQAQHYDSSIVKASSSDSEVPAYHFALIGEEMDHDYWRLVGEGAKQTERKYDVYIEYGGPQRSNPEEQLKLLDMAIKSKVDGIIVQALNDNFTDMMDKAVEQGIPVMTIDTDAPKSRRSAYIGTDNYAAGQLAGEALIEDTGGEATVGIITGSFENAHHRLRVEGFKDAIQQVAGIEIVAIEESNIARIGAEEKADKMLREEEDITAIYGTSALDGIGITGAADSLNRLEDLYVITFDTLEENITLLEGGAIDALVEQEPFLMGYQSVEIMLDIVEGKPVSETRHTDISIIRQSDLPYWNNQGDGDHD